MNKRAICTGTAPLFWKFIFLFERPRTRLVRKTGSPNQSMGLVTQKWVTSHMSESWSTLMICVAQEWVTSQTRNALLTLPDLPTFSWMSHVTHEWVISHMNESCSTLMSRVAQERVASYTHSATMGWLRLVGCLKIYVSLQNIGLFCRSLLQKRPIFLSILLIVATPYWISQMCLPSDAEVTSHMHELRHIWMSHVTYKGVMSRMKESCHI